MQPTEAKFLKVKLFEGESWSVERDLVDLLSQLPPRSTVVTIQYNYQGAEYDGQAEVHRPTHGVLIAYMVPVQEDGE